MGSERDAKLPIPPRSSTSQFTACAEFCSLPHLSCGSQPASLKTVNSKLYFTNPLKLVVTQSSRFLNYPNCQWLYSGYSGGVLSGNNCVSLNIGVGENCNVVLTTQEYPKISASDNGSITKQDVTGRVADKGLLAVLPDPILCYRNARYHQQQVYNLTSGGNLILLDWVMAGRIALGEVWDMASFVSEHKVYVDGKLVSGDAISLSDLGSGKRKHALKDSLQHTKVLGSCVFVGPSFTELKWTIKDKVTEILDGETEGLTAAASVLNRPFCDGVVVKLLAVQSTEQARSFFRRLIEDVVVWIGGDPLNR